MRETAETTATQPLRAADRPEKDEITVPIATICSRTGGPRSARAHWLKKKGESAPRRTLDWMEIGEPAG